jgi:enamine deaminase RidA (YjgF/YER057c/UK114 family)
MYRVVNLIFVLVLLTFADRIIYNEQYFQNPSGRLWGKKAWRWLFINNYYIYHTLYAPEAVRLVPARYQSYHCYSINNLLSMEKIKKKCINPNNLFNSQQFGFSQIVVAGTGKNVFISGQVAWDENFKIIGKGDLAIQTDKSLANLAAAINLAGGTLDDIVMLRIYIVNYKKEDGSVINKGLKKYFGTL